MFLAGAFVPIAILVGLAFHENQRAQSQQAHLDLNERGTTYEKLINLRLADARRTVQTLAAISANERNQNNNFAPYISALQQLYASGEARTLIGKPIRMPALTASEQRDLENGLFVLRVEGTESQAASVYLVTRSAVADDTSLWVADINMNGLLPELTGSDTQICILIGELPIQCPADFIPTTTKTSVAQSHRNDTADGRWMRQTKQYIAQSRTTSFSPPISGLPWTVVVARPVSGTFFNFIPDMGMLILAASATLMTVVLLSIVHIRRTLFPLNQLLEATQHVAHQDFSCNVSANSKDEIGELARSFNAMSLRLAQHFKILKLLSNLDRLILSRADIDHVATHVLEHLHEVVVFEAAALVLCDPKSGRINRTSFTQTSETRAVQSNRFSSSTQQAIAPGTTLNSAFLKQRMAELGLLDKFLTPTPLKTNFLAIQTEDGLSGMFVIGRMPDVTWDKSDDICTSDIADRIGVAIAAAQKEQQLFLQTRFDHLTRLPNRLLFGDRLVQEMARSHRNGNMLALLYIDLDFFKQVNDSLGHSAGDQVLRGVALRLRSSVRDSDTVARLSGDEFAVILTDLTQVRDASLLARSIIQRLSEPFTIETQQCFLCASIGITLYPTDGQEPENLLRNADIAMYRAKEAGKGRYVFYEERMNQETHNLANLDRELRLAVESNQFVLHFQPQIDLATGAVCGVEALLRWEHPERGLLPPAYFMSHAETSGLIEPLGELVLVKACENYNQWQMLGIAPGRISINASPRQFKRPDFYRFVEATLTAAGIPPHVLEIEITETVLMEESDLPRTTISKLAALGVRIAIDDFGTGYSSLSYLKRLPFHILKIDRSFVRDVNTDEDARTIAATIIAMAHSLRKEVVAEGVDHADQLSFLIREHCDQVQGYLISQPLANNDFEAFLRAYRPSQLGSKPPSALATH